MLLKTCTKCKQEKPIEEFQKDTRIKSGYTSICHKCYIKRIYEWGKRNPEKLTLYGKRWKDKNPDKVRASRQRYFAKHKDKIYARHHKEELEIKIKVLTYYGNGKLACVRCGFDDIRALTIDHIMGNGAEHRKQVGMRNSFRWLNAHDYPEGFQSLCMNCQWIKRDKKQELPNPH